MHKYHYGYLGRGVYAAYCACGWTTRTIVQDTAQQTLFVAFIEHLEDISEDS